jgi:hypothetical protein
LIDDANRKVLDFVKLEIGSLEELKYTKKEKAPKKIGAKTA